MATNNPYRYGSNAQDVVLTDSQAIPIQNTAGGQIDPATEQTLAALADALDSQSVDEMRVDLTQQSGPAVNTSATVAAWNAGTLSTDLTDQQGRNLGKARLMNSANTLIDPATEATLSALAGALASNATDTLQTEQQSPVGVEDSAGAQVNPHQQPNYNVEYTSIDLNTAATNTIYSPASDAEVKGVHLQNGGSTAAVRLEVTDGTSTSVIADPGAGGSLHISDDLYLDAGDSLQVVVETAEGAALTGTASVSRGEL